MKTGMCLFLWTTHVTEDHAPLLRDIKACGFTGVEVPIFGGTVDHYARLGALLDQIGLERTAVSAMGDPAMNLIGDGAARVAGVDYMRHVIDCARALGANRLSGPLHSTLGQFSGNGPTAGEFRRFAETQARIGDHAGALGVVIGLEALNRFECYLFNTMASIVEQVAALNHPAIRVMYDTFHCNIEEQDPIAAFSDHVGWISHVHISENDRGVPGRGNIPWAETFRAIRDSGYDDWLTIEAFGRGLPDLAAATKVWRDFAESPEAVYRDGLVHILRGWAEAGEVRG